MAVGEEIMRKKNRQEAPLGAFLPMSAWQLEVRTGCER